MANAEIVSIGSELLLGQTVDTNSVWLAQRLTELGINLFYKTVVGDNPIRLAEVIEQALERSDIVITGGGLGPTQDDLTREVVANVIGRKLIKDPSLDRQLRERFHARGMIMTPNNERQTYIPEGALPIENPNGTAPSFVAEDSRGTIFCLPGVPFELKWLFDNEVSPFLQSKFCLAEIITYRVLKVAELGESRVDDAIGHLIHSSKNPTVGVLAHPGQVDIRITAKATDENAAHKLILPIENQVRRILGQHIFATDDQTMEDTIRKLLTFQRKTISAYEDLTGGLVASRLQESNPKFFIGGIIGNTSAKTDRLLKFSLGQDASADTTLDPADFTRRMAKAIRSLTESNLGIALHAIADPADKSENLAGGQTYIAITNGTEFVQRDYNYGGLGLPDRTRMSFNAIELLRSALINNL